MALMKKDNTDEEGEKGRGEEDRTLFFFLSSVLALETSLRGSVVPYLTAKREEPKKSPAGLGTGLQAKKK